MMKGLWGTKIGMTQIFSDNKVVPVTVVDVSDWFVLQIKTVESDGYSALQVGRVRKRYADQALTPEWLKKPKKYFGFIKEVKCEGELAVDMIGKPVDFNVVVTDGDFVDITGTSKGCGFAGVVRRHGFRGPPASHGHTMGKRPGSMSFMRSRGRVIKGKRLPGHMGNVQHTIKNLKVVSSKQDLRLVLVKGAVPGKSGSLVFLRKV